MTNDSLRFLLDVLRHEIGRARSALAAAGPRVPADLIAVHERDIAAVESRDSAAERLSSEFGEQETAGIISRVLDDIHAMSVTADHCIRYWRQEAIATPGQLMTLPSKTADTARRLLDKAPPGELVVIDNPVFDKPQPYSPTVDSPTLIDTRGDTARPPATGHPLHPDAEV